MIDIINNYYIIGLSAPLSAGITAGVSILVSSIISSLLTLLGVYLCCGKRKGNQSNINSNGHVYDIPSLPGNSLTRTSEFEMKGNQAYNHVNTTLSRPRSSSIEYEIVIS